MGSLRACFLTDMRERAPEFAERAVYSDLAKKYRDIFFGAGLTDTNWSVPGLDEWLDTWFSLMDKIQAIISDVANDVAELPILIEQEMKAEPEVHLDELLFNHLEQVC